MIGVGLKKTGMHTRTKITLKSSPRPEISCAIIFQTSMKFQDTFFKNVFDLGLMFLMQHTIDVYVYGHVPIKQVPGVPVAFASEGENVINPYKPSVLCMGHRQTAQTHIRHRRTRCMIRISTVC